MTSQRTSRSLLTPNTNLIWKGRKRADFELRLKFRIVGSNSGVLHRTRFLNEAKYLVGGYRADINSVLRSSSGGLLGWAARGEAPSRFLRVDGNKSQSTISRV